MIEYSENDWLSDTCDPLKRASDKELILCNAISHGNYPGRILDENFLPELISLGYWDCTIDQSWGLEWHRNEGIEITFLGSGRVTYSTSYDKHLLKSGDITGLGPWQLHKVGDPWVTASHLFWLILDVRVNKKNSSWVWPDWILLSASELKVLQTSLQAGKVCKSNKMMRKLFEQMNEILQMNDIHKKSSHLKIYINELLLALHDNFLECGFENTTSSPMESSVQKLIDTLPKQLGTCWTLEMMADECQLGRTRFAHYFKSLTNSTPLDYLKNLRLDRVAELLLETNKESQELAGLCGFGSTNYMNKQFKIKYGCSPSQWRLNNCAKFKRH